jgi:hypothetical protein
MLLPYTFYPRHRRLKALITKKNAFVNMAQLQYKQNEGLVARVNKEKENSG